MLKGRSKKYLFFVVTLLVASVLLYYYAYQKGFSNGLSNHLTDKLSVLQKSNTNVRIKNNTQSSEAYSGLYFVTRVVDGDTLDVEASGKKVRVRLLGINSPESVDPRRSVECFGKESKEHMTQIAFGEKVSLELDKQKPAKDEYGRVLAYIRTENGIFLNQIMIENGYAYEYTYKSEKYKYQGDFKVLEKEAKSKQLGLWAVNTCSGKK